MKIHDLVLIAYAVEKIADITDALIPDIIDALIGVAWDEELAGRIKDYHADEEDV